MSACPDPSVLFEALGIEGVTQRAAEGDREAQWSLGYALVGGVGGADGGAENIRARVEDRRMSDVGFALCTAQFPVAHRPRRVDVVTWPSDFCAVANPGWRRAWRSW